LAGATFSVEGIFSGTSLDPANLDTNGAFSLVRTLSVGGRVAYSDVVQNLRFSRRVPTGDFEAITWIGSYVSMFGDPSVISSPFLDAWFAFNFNPDSQFPDWTCIHRPDRESYVGTTGTPEPEIWAMLVTALSTLGLMRLRHARMRVR
jgi:hypothetical protein